MTYPKRYNRMMILAVSAALFALGAWIVFSALEDNTQFFYNASDVATDGFVPESEIFRMGGLVMDGTITKSGIATTFQVDDFERVMAKPIYVTYEGALPDLFREGQGVVVSGRLISPSEIMASKVLAKHDENYQPKINYEDEKSPS